MIVKKHLLDDNSLMLAISDEQLIGKKISSGKKQLNMDSEFYKGETMNEEKLKNLVKEAKIINAAGEKSIKFLKKLGLIEKVSFVKKIPYAQISYL